MNSSIYGEAAQVRQDHASDKRFAAGRLAGALAFVPSLSRCLDALKRVWAPELFGCRAVEVRLLVCA
jgi:tRNA U34 5-methylaminomethyl-2-thiouridine-forming methyltransferase MnmC